jgi:hypothetical protein
MGWRRGTETSLCQVHPPPAQPKARTDSRAESQIGLFSQSLQGLASYNVAVISAVIAFVLHIRDATRTRPLRDRCLTMSLAPAMSWGLEQQG